jgi:hypothetical protein
MVRVNTLNIVDGDRVMGHLTYGYKQLHRHDVAAEDVLHPAVWAAQLYVVPAPYRLQRN